MVIAKDTKYGPRFVCEKCDRDQRTEALARRCERSPLPPELPLPPGTVVLHRTPMGAAEFCQVIRTNFMMNGAPDIRTGAWRPHYRMYVVGGPHCDYDHIIGVEEVLSWESVDELERRRKLHEAKAR